MAVVSIVISDTDAEQKEVEIVVLRNRVDDAEAQRPTAAEKIARAVERQISVLLANQEPLQLRNVRPPKLKRSRPS